VFEALGLDVVDVVPELLAALEPQLVNATASTPSATHARQLALCITVYWSSRSWEPHA
jgi:ABC-type Fe3+-hydroxamate transport system substrate-binding protein